MTPFRGWARGVLVGTCATGNARWPSLLRPRDCPTHPPLFLPALIGGHCSCSGAVDPAPALWLAGFQGGGHERLPARPAPFGPPPQSAGPCALWAFCEGGAGLVAWRAGVNGPRWASRSSKPSGAAPGAAPVGSTPMHPRLYPVSILFKPCEQLAAATVTLLEP